MSSAIKVAIITGATRGIGLATAKKFHTEWYHSIILDRDNDSMQGSKTLLKQESRYSFFFVMFPIHNK
jgi:meso-butanediol dehydrogenase / (S,S)-butanediol dehydrogenase / diacetyl reductase